MTTRKPGTVAAVNRAIDAIIKKNPTKPSPPKRQVKLIAMNPLKVKRETTSNDYALVSGDHWTVRFFANKTEPKGIADITFPAANEASAQRFVSSLEKAGASGVAVIALRKVRTK